VLDQWRSRRVQLDGRLAWLPGGHPALAPIHCQRPQLALRRTEAGRARSQASFPTVAQVRTPLAAGGVQPWGCRDLSTRNSQSQVRTHTAADIGWFCCLWLPNMVWLLVGLEIC
jgi:hypothetical protein